MLRQTKQSLLDGKPIITLPKKTEVIDYVTLDADELAAYSEVEATTKKKYKQYRRAGTVGRNMAHMLVLLLR